MKTTRWFQAVMVGVMSVSVSGAIAADDRDDPTHAFDNFGGQTSHGGGLLPAVPTGTNTQTGSAPATSTTTQSQYQAPLLDGRWVQDADGNPVYQRSVVINLNGLQTSQTFSAGRMKTGEVRDAQGNLMFVSYQYPVSTLSSSGDMNDITNRIDNVEFSFDTGWIACTPGDVHNQIDSLAGQMQAIDAQIIRAQQVMTRASQQYHAGIFPAHFANIYQQVTAAMMTLVQQRQSVVNQLHQLRNVR